MTTRSTCPTPAPRTRHDRRADDGVSGPARLVALAAIAATGWVTCLSGCDDSEVAAQVAATNELTDQTRTFVKASEGIGESNRDARAAELATLASQTAGIGVTNDQKAASGLLAAEMAETAAGIHADDARDLEMWAARQRAVIASAADAAANLEAIATADETLSLAADREFLKLARLDAEAALKSLQAKVKELESPIGELKESIETRRERLVSLQQEAETLRRQANDAGASAGFPYVEESAHLRTNAAQLRATIASDELSLFELEPELTRANLALNGAQSVASAAETATQALENFSTEVTTNARRLRQEADALSRATQLLVDELAARLDESLMPAYQKATALYETAARSASRGGAARELAAAGAEAKVDALSSAATLGAQQIAGIDAQIAMHEKLAHSGSLFGGESKQRESIDALAARRDEVLAASKERFAAAIESVRMMNQERPTVARTKTALESTLARIEGRSAEPTAAPALGQPSGVPAPAGGSAATGAILPVGMGFASVEELNGAFGGLGTDPVASLAASRKGFAFSTPDMAEFFEVSLTLAEPMLPFAAAVDAKFGEGSAEKLLAGMNAGMSMRESFEPFERDGKPFLRVVSRQGTFELPVVSDKGRHFVLGDELFASLPKEMIASIQMMRPMLDQVRGQISAAIGQLTQMVNSGQIQSLDQLRAAFQQAASMGGSPGPSGSFDSDG